jgi:hypothetical protein
MSKIKRAVSLYSYQDEYATKRMSLDDILHDLSDMGAEGVEILSDQMIHGSPHPTKETIENWKSLVKKYNIYPVSDDIFVNSTLYHNRRLTLKEQEVLLKDELINAHNLGFTLVRLVSNTDAALIKPCLPLAQELNVTMALEIHAGMSFSGMLTQEYLKVMKELHTKYVGIVLDMGIFCNRYPRISRNYFSQFGLNQELADFVDTIFSQGSDPRTYISSHNGGEYDIPPEIQKMIKAPIDREFWIMASGYENTPFSVIDEYIPYVKSIHGKLYEMTDTEEEYSIPYKKVIEYLDSKNWEGYIATEYEGNRFVLPEEPVDGAGNVRRHQAMLKKYIGR